MKIFCNPCPEGPIEIHLIEVLFQFIVDVDLVVL